jgi:tRNA threonylcarbamoyladenosine biosynthesis protein TsaB
MLAIETSSRRGSVALAADGGLVAARRLTAERPHTAALIPAIADMLRDAGRRPADIDLFAYSSGPGSFTGLRVAATVGRMLQSAVGCAVAAVSTLEVLARNALDHPEKPRRIAAILDAKRRQVYGAVFERVDDGELRVVVAAGVYDPASWFAKVEQPFWILGEGVRYHGETCESSGGTVLDESYWEPSAEQVVVVGRRLVAEGRLCRPEQIVPLYLRPPACEEVYEQRRAEARRRRGE